MSAIFVMYYFTMRNHKNPRVPKKRMVGNVDKQAVIDTIGGKLAVFGGKLVVSHCTLGTKCNHSSPIRSFNATATSAESYWKKNEGRGRRFTMSRKRQQDLINAILSPILLCVPKKMYFCAAKTMDISR